MNDYYKTSATTHRLPVGTTGFVLSALVVYAVYIKYIITSRSVSTFLHTKIKS